MRLLRGKRHPISLSKAMHEIGWQLAVLGELEHHVHVVHLFDLDTKSERVDARLDETSFAITAADLDWVQQQFFVTPVSRETRFSEWVGRARLGHSVVRT